MRRERSGHRIPQTGSMGCPALGSHLVEEEPSPVARQQILGAHYNMDSFLFSHPILLSQGACLGGLTCEEECIG